MDILVQFEQGYSAQFAIFGNVKNVRFVDESLKMGKVYVITYAETDGKLYDIVVKHVKNIMKGGFIH